MHYLCTWAHLFRAVGETPPDYAKEPRPVEDLPRWYAALSPRERQLTQRLSGMPPPGPRAVPQASPEKAHVQA